MKVPSSVGIALLVCASSTTALVPFITSTSLTRRGESGLPFDAADVAEAKVGASKPFADASNQLDNLVMEEDLWARLEQVATNIRQSSKSGSSMVGAAAIEREDPTILRLLTESNGLDLNAPTTWSGLIKNFLSKGAGGFIALSIFATCLYRLSLVSTSPLGVDDLMLFVATRIFWEIQEWVIHSHWFHGTTDGRAMTYFKSHDRHHDLPYYHIAVEPLRMAVVWWMVVLSLSEASVSLLGAPQSSMATFFAAYQINAITYAFMHVLLHSRVSLPKGSWLAEVKLNHVKHHISPLHYLNMGPNNIDKIMKTDAYDERLLKSRMMSNVFQSD